MAFLTSLRGVLKLILFNLNLSKVIITVIFNCCTKYPYGVTGKYYAFFPRGSTLLLEAFIILSIETYELEDLWL